ncbi:MAG: response regulator transcription factor [Dehalococcoidia bacterium]|nr:response regulator transcription factor [Dehalococcoidia bacterium]
MDRIKILLVDDHTVVRETIGQFLSREPDLEVVGEAGDGEEGVRLARKLKPDVVIIDVSMPKLNGIEATKQIKEHLPATTVLALSAYDYDQYVFALLDAGCAGYLLKDVSSHELVDAIRAVNRGDSVLHPSIARKVVERYRALGSLPRHRANVTVLTGKEIDVLKKAASGLSNKDIAAELFVSVRTIESILTGIFNKMGVGSRTEAVIYGLRRGCFTLEDLETDKQ